MLRLDTIIFHRKLIQYSIYLLPSSVRVEARFARHWLDIVMYYISTQSFYALVFT